LHQLNMQSAATVISFGSSFYISVSRKKFLMRSGIFGSGNNCFKNQPFILARLRDL